MRISLVDVDGHNFPNLALMKLSSWHKAQGDIVDWYHPLFSRPEKIYASKVFTFTPDYRNFAAWDPAPIRGGTGYRMYNNLPEEVDSMLPDYSMYPAVRYRIGFLSRGCIRNCPWCCVPKKEGTLQQYDDVERIAQGGKWLILLDNNFLANDENFIEEQLEKICKNGYRVDFNQGLDARLMSPKIAAMLARCQYKSISGHPCIRFACDTMSALPPVREAVRMLRMSGYKKEFSVYVLAKDAETTLERIRELVAIDEKLSPMVMVYRDFEENGQPDPALVKIATWCNRPGRRKRCDFSKYSRRKQIPPQEDLFD